MSKIMSRSFNAAAKWILLSNVSDSIPNWWRWKGGKAQETYKHKNIVSISLKTLTFQKTAEKTVLNSQADCELKSDSFYRKINKHHLRDLLWNYPIIPCLYKEKLVREGNTKDVFYYFAVVAYWCSTEAIHLQLSMYPDHFHKLISIYLLWKLFEFYLPTTTHIWKYFCILDITVTKITELCWHLQELINLSLHD